MKIAHIVLKTIPYAGGIEKYMDEVGPRLAQRGHQITLYTMRHYGKVPSTYKGMNLVPVWALNSKSFEKITASFVATLKACFSDAEIVHYHAFTHQFMFLPRLFGKRVVLQGHGLEWKRSRWNFVGKTILRISEALSVWAAQKITAVSKIQVDYLKSRYGRDCVYIPTGVNPPIRRKPSFIRKQWGLKGDDYILFAARLVPEKRAQDLIQAYLGLSTRKKLVIAGDAAHEEKYIRRLKEMAAGHPQIIFTGFVSGKPLEELMTNPYLFVLPSEIEGLPTALLEALSYGNCCVASDIPENAEALAGKGHLFRATVPSDLQALLQRLLDRPDLVKKTRTRAAQTVLRDHSWDKIAARFEGFYQEIFSR